MGISTKIIGGYIVILALLIMVAAAGSYSLTLIQDSYSEFIDVDEKLIAGADELGFKAIEQIADYRGFLLYPEQRDPFLERLRQGHREFNVIIGEMRERVITEVGLNLLEGIANLQQRRQRLLEDVVALTEEGSAQEALLLSANETLTLTQELMANLDAFRERQRQLIAERRAMIDATVDRNSAFTLVVILLTVMVSLAIGFYLSRAVTRQLRDSIAQLSASSAEILAATTQVAAGAAETATAMSETTTTVEEVKQTAQVSSQKAKDVSERAQQVAQVAHSGKKTVEDSVAGMHHIQEQMGSIAQSIVELSEQSQAIGEIIATVNNLAEQSNLLAVNAAIEAAKAGEYGKGFAVVAHEVRSLAGQSRQATTQVRTMLGDIQKGTGTAVMAIEQGSKAVDAGLKQAREAGESINALADSIAEAAQAAMQIAASSQQQLVGMDQVALAMEDIRQAASQNAAGIKQVEGVARNLHDLGRRLAQLLQRHKA